MRPLSDGVNQRLERGGLNVDIAAADQETVAAGGDRLDGGVRHRIRPGDGLHLQVVAQDDALVTELVAQQRMDDAWRQRGRLLFVERGDQHVRGHDEGDPRANGLAERHELDASEPVWRMLDDREVEVRVDRRVAMSREMLATRRDAIVLQPADDRCAERRHHLGRFGERAIADDRILRVGMDVEDGRVIERDADRLQLRRQRRGERAASAGSPLRPSMAIGGHSVNGARSRATRPPSWSTLTQSGNSAASVLRVARELGHLLGRFDVAAKQDDAAELKLARQRSAAPEGIVVAGKAADQQLADVTANRGGTRQS